MSQKVEDWVNQLQELFLFARTDPHAAYTAFTYGFIPKWKYGQRTIPDKSDLFKPLKECILNEFITSLEGRGVSDTERTIFELSTKPGGINIPNTVNTTSKEN